MAQTTEELLLGLEKDMRDSVNKLQTEVNQYNERFAGAQELLKQDDKATKEQKARFDVLKKQLAAIDPTKSDVLPKP